MGEVKEWNEILEGAEEGLFFGARLFYEEALGEEYFALRRKDGLYKEMGTTEGTEEDSRKKRTRRFRDSFETKLQEEAWEKRLTVFEEKIWEENTWRTERERERVFFERFFPNGEVMLSDVDFGYEASMNEEQDFFEYEGYGEEEKYGGRRIYDIILAGKEGGMSQRVTREIRDKILAFSKDDNKASGEKVKIEVRNTNNITRDVDIDRVTSSLTERLCEIMAKSADGLY